MPREKDTREILRGVQLPEAVPARPGQKQGGITLRTYHADADLDELEARLTPEQVARLKAQGALAGDWRPGGDPEAGRERRERAERLRGALVGALPGEQQPQGEQQLPQEQAPQQEQPQPQPEQQEQTQPQPEQQEQPPVEQVEPQQEQSPPETTPAAEVFETQRQRRRRERGE